MLSETNNNLQESFLRLLHFFAYNKPWVLFMKKYIKNLLWYIVGSIIYSVAVTAFISSNEISPGGLTGVATVVNYLSGIPTGITVFVLNIPILILGLIKLGGKFIVNTTLATAIVSAALTVSEVMLPKINED